MQAQSLENVFARSWSLLAANPVILIPGIVVGIGVGVMNFIMLPPIDYTSASTLMVGRAFGAIVMAAVGILAYLITQTYTVGMAGAAWQRGTATLADGARSFSQDAGRLLIAVLLLAAIGIIVGLVTFGLGWLVFLFFALYTIPAVVIGGLSPIAALQQSFSIATKRFVSTILIVLMLFVISIVVGLLALPLHVVPLLGPLIAAILTQAVVVYSTLVVVGEFLIVRESPDIAAL